MRLLRCLPGVVALAACTAPPRVTSAVAATAADPRQSVTAWEQVHRFHCARGADGAVSRCASDADCHDGRVCDTSAGCGCCVPPSPVVEPGATVHRYLFTGCGEGGRCAPPRYCEASADGATCAMRFDREVPLWVTTWAAPEGTSLAEVRRTMCILVEPAQDCLWQLDLPTTGAVVDAPFPTRYSGSYECGGRTCNGVAALRMSPPVGSSYTARLVSGRCGH